MHLKLFLSMLPFLFLSDDGGAADDGSQDESPPQPNKADESGKEPEDVSGLKASLKAARAERDEAKRAAAAARDAQTELDRLKAEAKKREEAEAAELGEWEKVAKAKDEELEQLKRQLAERDLRDRKAAIAKTHELPDELIERLHGETDDELEADAKALADLIRKREAPDTDAGQRTPPGSKRRDKSQFADPARWGLR